MKQRFERKRMSYDEQLYSANFEAMLMDLRRARWSKTAIAKELGIAVTSVANYSYGTEPLHPTGEKVIEFWCQQTGKSRTDVPKRPLFKAHQVRNGKEAAFES